LDVFVYWLNFPFLKEGLPSPLVKSMEKGTMVLFHKLVTKEKVWIKH
jgi:hypothetical protein